MKAKILLFVLLSLILVEAVDSPDCGNNKYLLLELSYDGNFTTLNKTIEKGCFPTYLHKSTKYRFYLIKDKESIYSSGFNAFQVYTDSFEEIMEGGVEILDKANFYLAMPYDIKAEKVEIYDNNTKVFIGDISDVGASSCREE